MRANSQLTARQLTSVSGRYRHDLSRVNAPSGLFAGSRQWQSRREKPQAALAGPRPQGRDHRLQRLEAVFFLAREPLTTRKLSQYANLADGTEARTLIRRLNELYDASGRAFRVERVAGGFQLMTQGKLAGWVRRLDGVPRETRLSAPALETLAVIAYRQPILRVGIEAIRGVNCGEILRQLMDRELVRIGGRSEDLGRPYLYATTKHFLRVFGLDSLESLPRVEQMRRDGPDAVAVAHPEGAQANALGQVVDSVSSEEEGSMPVLTRSGLTWNKPEFDRDDAEVVDDPRLASPRLATAFDEDEEDEEEFEDEDEDEDEDEFDDELEEEELAEEELKEDEPEDEELEDEWEEVDDEDEEEDEEEEEWEDEEDDSEWDFDDDEEEEEDDDEDWE
jgi:segregation and condensation protein B